MKNTALNNLPESFLKTLQTAFKKYAVDFSLIGAFARDYHFEQKGETRYRSTKDVDWVVSVSSTQKFDEMIAFLCANNFQRASDSKFRLIYDRRIEVDIIPFGAIENEPNYAEWADSDNWGLMSTQGLWETVAHSSIVNIEDISIKTASLESIVLLKLIAYNDRPERRKKDAEDIAVILSRYFDMMFPDIYAENNTDLITNDTDNFAAAVLGREIGKIIADSVGLQQQIVAILEKHTAVQESKFIQIMVETLDSDYLKQQTILEFLQKGLQIK